MAWLERRGERFRLAFRVRGGKYHVNLTADDSNEADGCLARLEENLRLVERGRLEVPAGADFGLFLRSDGKLEKPVQLVRSIRPGELFHTYQTQFTAGAKEQNQARCVQALVVGGLRREAMMFLDRPARETGRILPGDPIRSLH